MNLKGASIVGYIVLVLSLITLIMNHSILAAGFLLITIQSLAVVLMVWARITFGRRSFHAAANPTEGGLVTTGPYKFIRHPIYASILYFIWAGTLSHLSVVNMILAIVGTVGISVRIYSEEHLLLLRYPEYSNYAVRIKRVVPFLL